MHDFCERPLRLESMGRGPGSMAELSQALEDEYWAGETRSGQWSEHHTALGDKVQVEYLCSPLPTCELDIWCKPELGCFGGDWWKSSASWVTRHIFQGGNIIKNPKVFREILWKQERFRNGLCGKCGLWKLERDCESLRCVGTCRRNLYPVNKVCENPVCCLLHPFALKHWIYKSSLITE